MDVGFYSCFKCNKVWTEEPIKDEVICPKCNYMLLAKYECVKCKHKWKGNPGMVNCPLCQNTHVKWLDFEHEKFSLDYVRL